MTDSQFICLALEFPPRPSKHTEATVGLNKCRSGCEPAHLSFAAQRSADSDFQRTAHLQCVNKRPIHSATGARLVLYQTPAKPDIRPANAKVCVCVCVYVGVGGWGGVYTGDSSRVYPQVSTAQCPLHRPWVPEAQIRNPPSQLCPARALEDPSGGLIEGALGKSG